MSEFLAKIGRLLGLGVDPAEAEAARLALAQEFLKRCGRFKVLIASNNQALEIMAELEEALTGARQFGMSWLRASCAKVTAAVYKMVRSLNEMTDNRHAALYQSLGRIQHELSRLVDRPRPPALGALTIPLERVTAAMAAEVGPKMANLGELGSRLGLSIPDGFVVTASGYRAFMEHRGLGVEIDRLVQSTESENADEFEALSSRIMDLIRNAELPEELQQALESGCRDLEARRGAGIKLALRSSALGEDLPGASFAGQFHTELGVDPADAPEFYKEIVASNYGLTAMSYRFHRGIPDEDAAMCVGCLVMVDAAAGGVLYTRDPMDPQGGRMIVNAVSGLPKAVVDGCADPDRYALNRAEDPLLLDVWTGKGDAGADRCTEAGKGQGPVLDKGQILALARAGLALERHFGHDLDIEWALDKGGGQVFLQARHLSAAAAVDAPSVVVNGLAPLLEGGVSASPGAAWGEACVVADRAAAGRFPHGGVLVVAQALPRWAPLLTRAAAVVAETGSPAGHLGNVAREFGVPAVFGLAGARQALADAGEVTVDAAGGRVFPGKVEGLAQSAQRKNGSSIQGSPVFRILESAGKLIVPLRLLDPDAPGFSPENCRTLHDITRFCHEKSVSEMFSNRDRSRARSISRQLYHGAPLKYWIIDLGKGLNGPLRGKYVRIRDIASGPMLALWDGMLAVPWDGPPVLDARGFLAVIGQAASNPDLDPTRASAFEIKNYFMISDTFVSLQARYGFHFCTIEGLAGEETDQNYVCFRFKGGAADMDRRELRAEMVREILEEHGFRTELKHDAVSARVEGLDAEYMLSRLKILGYLIVHTKQMDMVMKNRSSIAYYKGKILADLRLMDSSGSKASDRAVA